MKITEYKNGETICRNATQEEIEEFRKIQEEASGAEMTFEDMSEEAYLKSEYSSIILEMVMEGGI